MEYQILDSGYFKKLEQVGPFLLERPAPGAIWRPRLEKDVWAKVDAKFTRFSGGHGKWTKINRSMPAQWSISIEGLKFQIEMTDFGHLGIFPEHLSCLTKVQAPIREAKHPFKVLNLFAYTGWASIALARAGAEVTHVDASKTSVAWARKNAELNGLDQAPIRWIVDDVRKFCEREKRRGVRYDGIILDPPSFGRGVKGEVWKIERDLIPLLDLLSEIKNDSAYILLSSHSAGHTPLALENLLKDFSPSSLESDEMALMSETGIPLPSGGYAFGSWNLG